MTSDPPRVAAENLRRFSSDVFIAAGMPEDHAHTVAEVLVWANLRGVDSHGVQRIPRYVGMIENQGMNPRPELRVVQETAASVLIEADRAAGPVAMSWAMEKAVAKAREAGIGWAMVRRMTHSGAIGYYTKQAVSADMAGLAFVSSLPNMAFHGARTPSIATSPIAFAVPGAAHEPLMLDMATAVIAGGRIVQARNAGEALQEGWALDPDGNPTTDAERATIPMPLGGPKGSGLSMMLECLISLMVGNPIISDELQNPSRGRPIRQNGLCIAVDISAFIDLETYRAQVDLLIETLKAQPRAEGVEEILVPGERGDRILAGRERDGIPVSAGTWKQLGEVADGLGVAMPETV